MIDFIKQSIEAVKLDKDILKNPILKFTQPVDMETGEVIRHSRDINKLAAKYRCFDIEHIENCNTFKTTVYIFGSIHKYYTGGGNHTDFNLTQLKTAISDLCRDLNIPPDLISVRSFEFGVNIKTSVPCSQIINGIVSTNRGKEYELKNFHGTGSLKTFEYDKYLVKIYNKSFYAYSHGYEPVNYNNLLRFEIRVKKMAYLHEKGVTVKNLTDLLNPVYHEILGNILLDTFRDLIIHDERVNMVILPENERNLLNNGLSAKYWQEYRKTKGTKQCQRLINQYRDIIIKNTPDNLQKTLSESIHNKWNELTEFVHFSPVLQKGSLSTSPPHIIGEIEIINKRECLITKLDISHQRESSKYISAQTINNYYSQFPELFNQLLTVYGPKDSTIGLNEVCYRIAHNIRNTDTNPGHNYKRSVLKNINVLRLNQIIESIPQATEGREIIQFYINNPDKVFKINIEHTNKHITTSQFQLQLK